MPTYEYICLDCNHKVEYFQSMKEPPRTVCPRCKGRLTRLVSSGAGLIFKGSGFYITDYKKKDNGSRHKYHPTETLSESRDRDKAEAKSEPKEADAKK